MNWFWRLWHGEQLDAQLEKEFRFHIQQYTDDLIAQGYSPEEAHRQAMIAFGGTEHAKEECRQTRGTRWLEDLGKDLRYSVRVLLQSPSFAMIAVLTLALGIGANTAMFSVVNAVLLRPLPFPHSERLMSVAEMYSHDGAALPNPFSYPDYFDVQSQNRSFDAMASYREQNFSLSGNGKAIYLRGKIVGSDLFKVLGVQPALGRAFRQEDDQDGHHVAVISDALWNSRFHRDDDVVGRNINLSGNAYTIVGVAPAGFQFPVQAQPTDIWVSISPDADPPEPVSQQRGAHMLRVIGRLKAGVGKEQAQADLSSIMGGLSRQYPDTNLYSTGAQVEGFLDHLVGDTTTPLTILLMAVGCVLLIACANVANLMLTRSSVRSREIAVRAALGASRGRLVRQLITEAVVLAVAGAGLGTLLATWGVAAVVSAYPQNLPRMQQVTIDGRVLLFTTVLAVVTGILFGLVPALQASRPNLNQAMREGGRGSVGDAGHTRLHSVLVVAETAIGVMLLIGAGLLIRSLSRLSHVDLGFNPDHVLTANFDLSQTRYNSDQQDHFFTQLLQNIRALPGVTSAAASEPLPLGDSHLSISFNILERPLPPSQQPSADLYDVSSGFFEAMQMPLISGRIFDQHDTRNGKPVMIINQAFATRYFRNENPIGKVVEIGGGDGPTRKPWKTREIVGVVGDIRTSEVQKPPVAAYFVPLPQLIWGPPSLLIRTAGDPSALAPELRRVLASMDSDAPLYDVKTMNDYLALGLGRARFQTMLLTLFAGIALLLTAIGLYGVIAYTVAQRTHEFGLRMALGASRYDVLRMVLNRGLLLTLVGVGSGVVAALALARFITSLLYQIPPRDPMTYTVVCIVLSLVALLASYIPALRATRVEPMVALRYE